MAYLLNKALFGLFSKKYGAHTIILQTSVTILLQPEIQSILKQLSN
jgi:hypothetical protein